TFTCSNTIVIPASGVVLRGSGAEGSAVSTIKMLGRRHVAIATRGGFGGRRGRGENGDSAASETGGARTFITETYVPSGSTSLMVGNASGFATGDTIEIRRPVTAAW